MSQILAEKLDSVSHSPPPGSSESLLHLFHLNYPEIQTRQQMSGFLNDHEIPAILAKCIENGLQVSEYVRASVLPHPSFSGIRLIQIDCQPRHDRQVSLSFGIDEGYNLVPEETVPIAALDISGSWERGNRKISAYHSAATDNTLRYPPHNPPTERALVKRQQEQDPRVVMSTLHVIVSQIAVVPNPKAEKLLTVTKPAAETIGQVALSSAI